MGTFWSGRFLFRCITRLGAKCSYRGWTPHCGDGLCGGSEENTAAEPGKRSRSQIRMGSVFNLRDRTSTEMGTVWRIRKLPAREARSLNVAAESFIRRFSPRKKIPSHPCAGLFFFSPPFFAVDILSSSPFPFRRMRMHRNPFISTSLPPLKWKFSARIYILVPDFPVFRSEFQSLG